MESPFWDESSHNTTVKFEGNLNFGTAANSEDDEYSYQKKKLSRDPLSHRIIEKRRRDRMNNCLADLSRLIPPDYMKKGRGRIEKTEIIEMAIRHMKHLQTHPCTGGFCQTGVEEQKSSFADHYRLGFHECLSETMHFLVEVEGYFAGDSLCVQLMSHLNRHCDTILKSESLRAQLEFGKEERVGDLEEKFVADPQTPLPHQPTGDNFSETTSGRCSQPSNELSPTPSQTSCEKVSESSGLVTYKFKNRIQRRFESSAKRARQMSSETRSLPSPGGGGSVPIFALSPRGSYYLPLTVDYTLLSTQILTTEPVEEANLVLHPVTISVNFQPQRGQRPNSKEIIENT